MRKFWNKIINRIRVAKAHVQRRTGLAIRKLGWRVAVKGTEIAKHSGSPGLVIDAWLRRDVGKRVVLYAGKTQIIHEPTGESRRALTTADVRKRQLDFLTNHIKTTLPEHYNVSGKKENHVG